MILFEQATEENEKFNPDDWFEQLLADYIKTNWREPLRKMAYPHRRKTTKSFR